LSPATAVKLRERPKTNSTKGLCESRSRRREKHYGTVISCLDEALQLSTAEMGDAQPSLGI